MSIVRVIAVDPRPRPDKTDLVVYQIPEKSREFELLTELLDAANIEWTTLESLPRRTGLRKKGIK